MLLAMGLTSACSSDDELESIDLSSCISGTVHFDQDGQYVYISELNMPDEECAFSYIETVVVPQNEFPFKDYHEGDIISFAIVKVKSEYPIIPGLRDGLHRATTFLCSIKIISVH